MKKILLITTLSIFISGCIPTLFNLVDNDIKPGKKSIAVISGLREEVSMSVAHEMTLQLQKHSKFHVMSTRTILNKISGYPVKIRGPYTAAYMGIDKDFSNTDRNRVRMMQRRLGVDYLYIIWAPSAVESIASGSSVVTLHTITQLFAAPGTRQVGNSLVPISYVKRGMAIGKAPRSIKEAVQMYSEQTAKELAKKMKMQK